MSSMSWSSRLAVVGVAALLGVSSHQLAQAQKRLPATPPPLVGDPARPPVKRGPADPGELSGITLPTEEDLKRRLKEINTLIAAAAERPEEWPTAIDRLQQLLDRTDDVFAPAQRVGADGRVGETMVSVKAEA